MKQHHPCLILNQDYRPLEIIRWQRAICLEIIGKEIPGEGVRIIEYYEGDSITSGDGSLFPVPAVGVTNHYVSRSKGVPLKKRNLLVRDNKTCQYCGSELSAKKSTIDHVKPRSHFKNPKHAHFWSNVVIACEPCNFRKGDKTPAQANMKLLSIPIDPDIDDFYRGINPYMNAPKEWDKYV